MADLEKQELRTEKLQRLRALIREGIESGFVRLVPEDFETIKREGRAILATRSATQ